MKLEVVTDARGLPLGTTVAAANRAETDLIEDALDDIPVPLPERVPLVADRGYDSDPLRDRLRDQGIDLLLYVIERTNAWLHSYRRLANRWEYYSFIYHGFVRLACIVIAVGRL
jgi:transposase